jgi:copper transport protein
VTIDIFDSRRPSPGPVQQVLVTLSGPDGSAAKVPAVHLDDGSWVVAGYDMRQGSWRVQVSALRAGLPPATASYRWTVPGPGVPIATGLRGTSLAGLTTFLAISFVVVVAGLCLAGMLLVRRLRRPDQLPDASRSPADLRVH